jgi:hypothetical protein
MLKPSVSIMEKAQPLRRRMAEKVEWAKAHAPELVKSRAFRKTTTILAAFTLAVSFIVLTAKYTNAGWFIPKVIQRIGRYPTCQSKGINGTQEIWDVSRHKYENLRDDKFTYVHVISSIANMLMLSLL